MTRRKRSRAMQNRVASLVLLPTIFAGLVYVGLLIQLTGDDAGTTSIESLQMHVGSSDASSGRSGSKEMELLADSHRRAQNFALNRMPARRLDEELDLRSSSYTTSSRTTGKDLLARAKELGVGTNQRLYDKKMQELKQLTSNEKFRADMNQGLYDKTMNKAGTYGAKIDTSVGGKNKLGKQRRAQTREEIVAAVLDALSSPARTNDKKKRAQTKKEMTSAIMASASGPALIGTEYTNKDIVKNGCSVTVVLMDPRIREEAMWALESVAANIRPLNRTCVLLQTSQCEIKEALSISEEDAFQVLSATITSGAKPLFKKMIINGQVRISIINHKKYRLQSCDNFYNPSSAWLNHGYWGRDEFSELDSDLVLVVQSDIVLCHALNVERWNDFAWVSAPWPPKQNKKHGGLCMCSEMAEKWGDWHNGTDKIPPFPTEDELCSNDTLAPVGNGGLSLRSRRWLQKSIEVCPHPHYSGLDARDIMDSSCKVTGRLPQEDMVFATALRGIGAPLPTAYEASLFAAEMRFPHSIEDHYRLTDVRALEAVAEKRWSKGSHGGKRESGLARYRRMRAKRDGDPNNTRPIIPIGLHKPFRYHSSEVLKSGYMKRNCKYLERIM